MDTFDDPFDVYMNICQTNKNNVIEKRFLGENKRDVFNGLVKHRKNIRKYFLSFFVGRESFRQPKNQNKSAKELYAARS